MKDLTKTPTKELNFLPCRKLPVTVHAAQINEPFFVDTLEGTSYVAEAGDYLMLGVKGERYPCRKDIFESTYQWVGGRAPKGLGRYTIFCDMDGVLADFDQWFIDYHGRQFKLVEEEQGEDYAWDRLKEIPNFWYNLPLMPGAKELWSFIKDFNPILLTAPGTHDEERARLEKRLWVDNHLGSHVPITFRRRRHKQFLAAPDTILIDDMEPTILEWRERGGIAIHHTSIQETLVSLRFLHDNCEQHPHHFKCAGD